MKYRVQIRRFDELRQWRAGKYGWQSRAHFSAWKTADRFNNLSTAQAFALGAVRYGLKQARILFGDQTIFEC